MLYIKFPEKVY